MILYFLIMQTLVIEEESTLSYLTLENNHLVLTDDLRRAVDFQFVPADKNLYFYLKIPGTNLALDSEIGIRRIRTPAFVSPFRASPTQKWKFVFSKFGSLTMISAGMKLIRMPRSDHFTMVPIGKYKNYPGFVLFDATMRYFNTFKNVPLVNIENKGYVGVKGFGRNAFLEE